jgi:ligand-binding SRPBCC domain-containing protein
MQVKMIETKCFIPQPLEKVWDFFSSPINLNAITPDDLHFEILTDLTNKKMYPGMIIRYKIKPMLNIPMSWTTEITHCEEGRMFVDEQRFGPYAFWHHQHFFEAAEGGVWMTDTVHYAVGWGPLGWLASKLFVDAKLQHIFDYRERKVEELFGGKGC